MAASYSRRERNTALKSAPNGPSVRIPSRKGSEREKRLSGLQYGFGAHTQACADVFMQTVNSTAKRSLHLIPPKHQTTPFHWRKSHTANPAVSKTEMARKLALCPEASRLFTMPPPHRSVPAGSEKRGRLHSQFHTNLAVDGGGATNHPKISVLSSANGRRTGIQAAGCFVFVLPKRHI